MTIRFNKIIPQLGIQGKLTLIFILLSTLPLILLSIYIVQQQINIKQDEDIRYIETDVKGLKEKTSLFLTRIESEIMLVMKSSEMIIMINDFKFKVDVNKKIRQNLEKEFINILTANDYYLKISLLNTKGKEILAVVQDGNKPKAIEQSQLSKIPKIFYVSIANEMKPGEINLSPSEIKNTGDNSFISIIDFILPVYTQDNRLSAIVTVNLQAGKLFELLVPSFATTSKRILVVNGEGFYIFHSERKNNWNRLFTNKFDENIFHDYSKDIAQNILEGKTGTTLNQSGRIIQYSPIFFGSQAATNRYFIVEDMSANVVLPSVEKLKITFIVLIILVGIVSLIIGFLTARKFLRPIKQLITGTQIIRSGNLDYRLEIKTHDEIQELINNFNQLVLEWRQKQLLEKEIQKSEKLFSTLTQTASDAILEIDETGKTMVWNDAATRIFGYEKNEVMGKQILPLIVPERFRERAEKELSAFLAAESNSITGRTIEVDALKKDGTEFPSELSISVVTLENTSYITGIIRDITQRKIMLQELIESKEKAEHANKIKSEFLNQMSHEIRTPLNVLLTYSKYLYEEMLDKNLLSDDIDVYYSGIEDSGRRIIRTIELILNMSELQQGNYKNNLKTTDIYSEVLSKLINEFHSQAQSKNIQFLVNRKNNDSVAYVDAYSVQQILIHILDNAIKFTSAGNIIVTIDHNSNNELVISVEDTGIGISTDYLPNLYNLFSQEQQGVSREYDGNGLGLALTKKLCDMNNIVIDVSSVKKKGTTFSLTFKN